jgi:CHAT domain
VRKLISETAEVCMTSPAHGLAEQAYSIEQRVNFASLSLATLSIMPMNHNFTVFFTSRFFGSTPNPLSYIASLWSINELSSILLVVCFYGLWRDGGLAPMEALRQAQVWVRDTTNREKEGVVIMPTSLTFKDLLTAIEQLRPELPSLLGADSSAFETELDTYLNMGSVIHLLSLFGRYSVAHDRLLDVLAVPEEERTIRTGTETFAAGCNRIYHSAWQLGRKPVYSLSSQ